MAGAAEICRRLGVDITGLETWREYTAALVRANSGPGRLVDAARTLDGVASSGERVVLHAALAAGDFAWLADELAAGHHWVAIDRLGDEVRASVAAAILRRIDVQMMCCRPLKL